MGFIYVGLGLVAGSILVLEVALTRVFAILMWHHLSYMVISIAMLGLGSAGAFLTVRGQGDDPDREPRPDEIARQLAPYALLYGGSVVVSFLLTSNTPIDTLALWSDKTNLLRLGFVYVMLLVPFLFGGLVVGIALTRLIAHVNRLYFFDLAGSAIGAGASIWLLSTVGPAGSVLAAAAAGLLGSTCFAFASDRRFALISLPAAIALAAVPFAIAGGGLDLPVFDLNVKIAPGKELAGHEDIIERRIYSATAEVEVTEVIGLPPISGGDFGKVDASWIAGRFVGQDGSAPTALYEDGANLAKYPFLDDSQTAVPYVAYTARGGQAPEALVIGVGGGIDVMIALAHDARRVVAVEINQAMIEMVTTEYGDYIGGLFLPGAHPLSDRIELHRGEGRSYVRGTDEKFDIIQMSGVDSFTALSTGAYTLAESYLYTTEAVKDFFSRLEDDGYLSYSRFMMQPPKKPRETLRLAHIGATALREMGVAHPEAQILVFQGKKWASTLIKKGEFTQAEVDAVRRFGTLEEFSGLVYDPIDPNVPTLGREGAVPPDVRQAFDTVLRGAAPERDAFVSNYEYDLTPATDDSPFFFNYYRYGALLDRLFTSSDGDVDRYHPNFPVGHLVLLASLVQVTLLGAILIVWPIRRVGRRNALDRNAAGPVFAYFAALGAGFMFLEIALMQKMILFLGHPTYAVTVVLATLLAFAGAGSLLSERVQALRSRIVQHTAFTILALVAVTFLVITFALPSLIGWPLGVRMLIAVCVLAPLALVLGMPFPLGMRIVKERCPDLLPWAWSINAFLSVFSSILCIMLAMAIGFSNVLGLSAAIYAGGLLAMARWLSTEEQRAAE